MAEDKKVNTDLKELIADPYQDLPNLFLPKGVTRVKPKVLKVPRHILEKQDIGLAKKIKRSSSEAKRDLDRPLNHLDIYEIPKALKDIPCDKCKRVIKVGVPYFKFIWEDWSGTLCSSRTHKMCFELNPEKELH